MADQKQDPPVEPLSPAESDVNAAPDPSPMDDAFLEDEDLIASGAMQEKRRSRVAFLVASLLSLAWLALLGLSAVKLQFDPRIFLAPKLDVWADAVLVIIGPLGIIWLVTGFVTILRSLSLASALGATQRDATHMSTHLYNLEQTLQESCDRIAHNARQVEQGYGDIRKNNKEMEDIFGHLEARSKTMTEQLLRDREATLFLMEKLTTQNQGFVQSLDQLPQIFAHVQNQTQEIRNNVQESKQSAENTHEIMTLSEKRTSAFLGELGQCLDKLSAHRAQTEHALHQTITGFQDALSQSESQFRDKINDGTASLTTLLTHTNDTVQEMRALLSSPLSGMDSEMERGRDILRQLGEQVVDYIDTFTKGAAFLQESLAMQRKEGDALAAGLETRFGDLEERLLETANKGRDSILLLEGQLRQLHGEAVEIERPIETMSSRIDNLEQRIITLFDTTVKSKESIRDLVPEAHKARDGMENALRPMTEEIGKIQGQIENLGGPLEERITRQSNAIEEQRQQIEENLRQLKNGVQDAHSQINTVQDQVNNMAQTSIGTLGHAISHVHELAKDSRNMIETTLSQSIEAMSTSLQSVSERSLRLAFSEPMIDELAKVDAAAEKVAHHAREVSNKLNRQLIKLAETTQLVETYVIKADENLRQMTDDSLGAQSEALVDSLNSIAVDLTDLLDEDISDAEWRAYMDGDRSRFTRKVQRTLGRREIRNITAHFRENSRFRENAARYVSVFEELLDRTRAQTKGDTLAALILGSDNGKLYALLADALRDAHG